MVTVSRSPFSKGFSQGPLTGGSNDDGERNFSLRQNSSTLSDAARPPQCTLPPIARQVRARDRSVGARKGDCWPPQNIAAHLSGSFKAKAPLDLGRHAFACLLGSLLVVWPNRRTEKYGPRWPLFFRTLVLLYGPWFSKLASPSTHGDPRTPASLSPSGGACGTAWAVHKGIGLLFEANKGIAHG